MCGWHLSIVQVLVEARWIPWAGVAHNSELLEMDAGTEFWSLGIAASALNLWATSPAPLFSFFLLFLTEVLME